MAELSDLAGGKLAAFVPGNIVNANIIDIDKKSGLGKLLLEVKPLALEKIKKSKDLTEEQKEAASNILERDSRKIAEDIQCSWLRKTLCYVPITLIEVASYIFPLNSFLNTDQTGDYNNVLLLTAVWMGLRFANYHTAVNSIERTERKIVDLRNIIKESQYKK